MAQSVINLKSIGLLAVLCLVGCESDSLLIQPVATEPDLVGVRIAQAAEKASDALTSISAIEQQKSAVSPPQEDFSGAPPQLLQPITIRWTGPMDQISRTLASKAGLGFRTKGTVPPVPVTVSIDVYQQPLIHVLRDVGLQAGQRADLNVDAMSGVVEIRYAPVDKL
jgi:hypothetical protein